MTHGLFCESRCQRQDRASRTKFRRVLLAAFLPCPIHVGFVGEIRQRHTIFAARRNFFTGFCPLCLS